MNTEQLRQSVKDKWLSYYEENRSWLNRLGVWVNCDGQRRPASGFILATLSVLEPKLTQLLPLIVDLSSNPDRIVVALGLNFNPEDLMVENTEMGKAIAHDRNSSAQDSDTKMLPAATNEIRLPANRKIGQVLARQDESCRGSHPERARSEE